MLPAVEKLAPMVHALAKPGDYVICLGAGSITQWAYALPGELAALDKASPRGCAPMIWLPMLASRRGGGVRRRTELSSDEIKARAPGCAGGSRRCAD